MIDFHPQNSFHQKYDNIPLRERREAQLVEAPHLFWGGSGLNPVEGWIFLWASQFLQLCKIQVNYEDPFSIYFILYSFLKAFLKSSYDLLISAYNHNIRVNFFFFF